MKTKIVYVLTCTPEATYIEQALMAVFSARHWNPDAHIVLIVDENTSALLHAGDKRGEILHYISEEKIIHFSENDSMHYRSRWLKTKVRELVDGDFLFVDCDTICQKTLDDIDDCYAEIAMVPDEHMSVQEYPQELKDYMSDNAFKLGYDVLQEVWYFNSGVIYAKNTENVHRLWNQWHECWLEGEKLGVRIDQAALGKANLMCGHIIQRMDDVWNTLIYMNPIFVKEGKILHFWSFRNKSFLYTSETLLYIRKNGLTEFVKECVLNPTKTMLPFDNILSNYSTLDFIKMPKELIQIANKYRFETFFSLVILPWQNKFSLAERKLIKKGFVRLCFIHYTLRQFCKIVVLKHRINYEIYYS